MAPRPDLADLLTQLSREINPRGDLGSTLQAVVDCLHRRLPADHLVGIASLVRGGHVETRACSTPLVQELDRVQRSTGQGPCLHVLEKEPVVAVDVLQHEQRWSYYVPQALALGVRAQLAVRLTVDERPWGAINVYCTQAERIDPHVERLVTLLAVHAGVAVERSLREDNLRAALQTRKLIGQAVGLVMERFGLDAELAFRYLVRLSSNSNVKLREVAGKLVGEANNRA